MDVSALPEKLQGLPAETAAAITRFFRTRAATDLEPVLTGLIGYYRPSNWKDQPVDARDEARLLEDVGLDSLAMVEISYLIGDIFQLRFEDADLAGLRTMGDLRAMLQRRLGMAS